MHGATLKKTLMLFTALRTDLCTTRGEGTNA